jgi:hypothetical protein
MLGGPDNDGVSGEKDTVDTSTAETKKAANE